MGKERENIDSQQATQVYSIVHALQTLAECRYVWSIWNIVTLFNMK